MIRLQDISFTYRHGRRPAVETASAEIGPGLHLLLGENGAGKTTLLHIMDGLLHPQQGQAVVDGRDVWPRNPGLQRLMFYLADTLDLPFRNLDETVCCHAPFYPNFSRETLDECLYAWSLDSKTPFKSMSLGIRRKAQLSYAIALHTDFLLLDEPANGLDINSRKELRRLIAKNMTDEQTVIVSTHTVNDFEALFDGIIFMTGSRLLFSMPVWEISRRLRFAVAAAPSPEAIYQEPDGAVFRAVMLPDGSESQVDLRLLYSAIMSPARDRILKLLANDGTIQ